MLDGGFLLNSDRVVLQPVGPSPCPVAFYRRLCVLAGKPAVPRQQDTEVLPNLKHVVVIDDDLLVFS